MLVTKSSPRDYSARRVSHLQWHRTCLTCSKDFAQKRMGRPADFCSKECYRTELCRRRREDTRRGALLPS
jgi:endogenous inhibitor of DNA gyrase (YacG/DUF329 family)